MKALNKLDRFYIKCGDRGIMTLLFLCSVIIHTLVSLTMNMMIIAPDEFGMVSVSALICGKDWSGVMPEITGFHGFIQAVLYAPVMLLLQNPVAQYKGFLILNGIIISLVPVIAYKISLRYGVSEVWQRIAIAVGSGLYTTYIVHSKFIWSEAICGILPWILVLLLTKSIDCKKKSTKTGLSILCAFVTAVAYSANSRLFGMVVAAVILVILFRAVHKKTTLALGSYFLFLIIFLAVEYIMSALIQSRLDITLQANFIVTNGVSNSISAVQSLFSSEGFGRFFPAFFGQLFYFITSSWGIGAVFISLSLIVIFSFYYRKIKQIPQLFSEELVMLMLFVMLYLLLCCGSNALFCSQNQLFGISQEQVISGFGSDNVIPLAIFIVFVFIFKYGINLRKILGSVVTLGIIDFLALIFSKSYLVSGTQINSAEIVGIFPVRIGVEFSKLISTWDFYAVISCGFIVMAVFISVACCSQKYKNSIISLIILGLSIYSAVNSCLVLLPDFAQTSVQETAQVEEVSTYLYNTFDAPAISVYGTQGNTAMLLQYYNQDANVIYVDKSSPVSKLENTFVVAPISVVFNYANSNAVLIGRTADFNIYAYGEKAISYVNSQKQG